MCVDALFEQYLDREADSGALDFFAAELDHGASDEWVTAQLTSSPEYDDHGDPH